jgi:import inner membrane translocase subunit TIM50
MKDVKHTQQQIKENGEKWLKEEEDMIKQAEAEEMKKVKSNFFGFFGGGDGEDKKN